MEKMTTTQLRREATKIAQRKYGKGARVHFSVNVEDDCYGLLGWYESKAEAHKCIGSRKSYFYMWVLEVEDEKGEGYIVASGWSKTEAYERFVRANQVKQ